MPLTQGSKTMVGGSPFFDTPSTTKKCPIGTRFEADDGRVWYYGKANGTITVGELCQFPTSIAIAATYFGVDTSTAPALGGGGVIGDTVVRVNDIGTTIAANECAGGYLSIIDGTGEGYTYKIKQHDACSTDGSQTCDVEIYQPGIVVALDNTSVGTITRPLWDEIVESAAANPHITPVCGRAERAMTDGQYGWFQTWGFALVREDGATNIIAGSALTPSEATAGRVAHNIDYDEVEAQIVGFSLVGQTTSNAWTTAFLTICR